MTPHLLVAVVPVLPTAVGSAVGSEVGWELGSEVGSGVGWDAPAVATAALHGSPLFVHAARAAHALVGPLGAQAVVSTAYGQAEAVRAALAADGLAGVLVVESGDTLGAVLAELLPAADDATVLVHDPRCPLVTVAGLRDVSAAARSDPTALTVATRPMTDTVKVVQGGIVRGTVDRDLLLVLGSPLVMTAGLLRQVQAAGHLAGCRDVGELIEAVRLLGARVRWAPSPGTARRIGAAADVAVLECLTDAGAATA